MADRCLLYYITDRMQFRGDEGARRRALLAKIAEATQAGIDYIQLREKDLSAAELETLARGALTAACNGGSLRAENRELGTAPRARTRLLLNSRTDVALAAGADGVHLRADDIAPHEVRQILELSSQPPAADQFRVASSSHTVADVLRAEAEKADFTVFAPVFGKKAFGNSSAAGMQSAGLAALHEACHAMIPVLALGGVTIESAASCLEAGAAGVAGIRLFQENTIEDVVRALREL